MIAKKKLFKQIKKSTALFLTAAAFFAASLPSASFAARLNTSNFETGNAGQDEAFEKKFREGRNLIDKEEWAKAAEKFNEVIAQYPASKSTDAALYWLAFCYKKQKQFKETDAALDRLLKDFPASSWADDARVMKMEIGLSVGRVVGAASGIGYSIAPLNPKYSAELSKTLKGAAIATTPQKFESLALSQIYTTAASQTPLDREDEIKIAAFQSLLSADPKRAIETMGDILRTDSKASETLKQEVLRVLRSPRLFKVQAQPMPFFTNGISKQYAPLLRETLVKSFQNESNVKIRKEIIYALAAVSDDQSTKYLTQLYASENNREIKKTIINSLSGSSNGFYSFNTAAVATRKTEFDILLDIIRTEKDAELRRLAFSNLQHFNGWSANEQITDMLARLYDDETDEQFKISIIQTLANSKQNQASKKLLEIAKNDKSDKLRLEAIYSLRTSTNPEVLKFLEELIK